VTIGADGTTGDWPALGPEHAGKIAELCARSLAHPPTAEEIGKTIFSAEQPALVRGDPSIGVVAARRGFFDSSQGFISLIVVDPDHRGRGHGRSLLRAAERDLAGASTITVGTDAPFHLFPGVETTEIALLCLLERHRYSREEGNFNMDVDLAELPSNPGGTMLATGAERDEVDGWLRTHWPMWGPESLRALDQGTLLVERDAVGLTGFCAWDVNHPGLLGPIAVRPDLLGRGAGVALLLGGLHRMRASGRHRAEIAWVGPIVPYARVGARIGRVFFAYRKRSPE